MLSVGGLPVLLESRLMRAILWRLSRGDEVFILLLLSSRISKHNVRNRNKRMTGATRTSSEVVC